MLWFIIHILGMLFQQSCFSFIFMMSFLVSIRGAQSGLTTMANMLFWLITHIYIMRLTIHFGKDEERPSKISQGCSSSRPYYKPSCVVKLLAILLDSSQDKKQLLIKWKCLCVCVCVCVCVFWFGPIIIALQNYCNCHCHWLLVCCIRPIKNKKVLTENHSSSLSHLLFIAEENKKE